MRRLSFALFFAISVAAAVPALATETQPKPNYYPLSEGAKWYYKVEAPGAVGETYVVQAVKAETIDGVSLFRIETAKKGQDPISEHIRSDDTGVFRHRAKGIAINKPICLLKYPVKVGEKWEDEVEVAGQKFTMKMEVTKEEEVAVPAGKYKTVAVRATAAIGGVEVITTYWFADGVGIVKQSTDISGQHFSQELEKYEKGK
ncbi:MAG TPA: hypothetical protein VE988_29590 [Gemmataceae bacterium]|nr:hypothetical protein [Gemmataceae bacterium]